MKSFCRYFNEKTCQSCRFIEVDYDRQIKAKEERLKSGLSRFEGWKLLPSVGSATVGFRNKAKMLVTGSVDKPIIGLYGEGELDLGREILDCPVHHPVINDILHILPEFIQLARLGPYQIAAKKGELKGIIVYYSEGFGESYLRFVLRSKESLDRIKKQAPYLRERFPGLTCISANIQPIPHAIIEGEEEVILTDKSYVRHKFKDVEFRLGPKGFVQTNQQMAELLYQTAANWTREIGVKKFAELFCGQGAFSFFVASHVEQSVGFEINPDAVMEANATVKALARHNMIFKCADAASVGTEIKAFSPDLVLVDPPRRGLGGSVDILSNLPNTHLIYSSSSLESLVKDLEKLSTWFEVVHAQIFDMFPHTEHFETLVQLKPKA